MLNQNKWINTNINIFFQALISGIIILIVELFYGYIFNILLDLNLWDYSPYIGNILGQIYLPFYFLWVLISPLAFWVDDMIMYKFYGEGEYYSIIDIYKKFLMFWEKPYV